MARLIILKTVDMMLKQLCMGKVKQEAAHTVYSV